MNFPANMKRSGRLTGETRQTVDSVVADEFAANHGVTAAEILRKLDRDFGVRVSPLPVRKRLAALRVSGNGKGSAPPRKPVVQEEPQPQTAFSYTPMPNGKVEIVLNVELEPRFAGQLTSVIGELLSAAAMARSEPAA